MDNQQNNWFRNPQEDMLGENVQQNSGFNGRNQGQHGMTDNYNPQQNGMNYDNSRQQNRGAYYADEQIRIVDENAKKNKRLKAIIIMLVCVVLLALGALAAVLLMDGGEIGGGKTEPSGGDRIGEYITIGTYEQDNNENNGAEDIEWLVLDEQDGKVLVISKYILFAERFISYHQYDQNKWEKWDNSNVRKGLNVEFYDNAFSEEEKAMICDTKVSPGKNPYYGIDPGTPTKDKIFLLSVEEIEKYLPTEKGRLSSKTKFVETNQTEGFTYMWCTRTPGESNTTVTTVDNDGSFFYEGIYTLNYIGIRPAMWVELSGQE